MEIWKTLIWLRASVVVSSVSTESWLRKAPAPALATCSAFHRVGSNSSACGGKMASSASSNTIESSCCVST